MRIILHSDMNGFYASAECARHPEWRELPVVVCGDRESRHGIVLAKNERAKACGIRTGEVLWEAEKKCANLIEATADFSYYLELSRAIRALYAEYTDRVESFGIDECWLDVTESLSLFRRTFGLAARADAFSVGSAIADDIRARVREKFGLTASVGVADNKIFAKLASDYRKPDATTVFSPREYEGVVWNLPVGDLLYVGRATEEKLAELNIFAIGHLAHADRARLVKKLGKWGAYLHDFANGRDLSPVAFERDAAPFRSIGNSITYAYDLRNFQEARALLLLLSDSVAMRLRESGVGGAYTVKVNATDAALFSYGKQGRLPLPVLTAGEIAEKAAELLRELNPPYPLRGLGVTVSDFAAGSVQLGLLSARSAVRERAERAVDEVRKKYGNRSVCRAAYLTDRELMRLDIKEDHVIHPENFMNGKGKPR